MARWRIRPLPAAAVLSVAAVLLAAAWSTRAKPASDPTVGQVVTVGVVDGESIPAYLTASAEELARLAAASPGPGPAPMYALVSLTGYVAPDRLAPVFDGVTVAEALARAPLPGMQTEIVRIAVFRVPADVSTGMAEIAERKAAEAADYDRRAEQVTGDGAEQRQVRRVYLAGARRAAAEAAAYRDRCACVYAAVVRATPEALSRLASRPGVRAVDPAPDVIRLDRAVFRPPLPEQHDLVRPVPDDAIGSD